MQYLGIQFREMRKFTHSLNTLYHLHGLGCVDRVRGQMYTEVKT